MYFVDRIKNLDLQLSNFLKEAKFFRNVVFLGNMPTYNLTGYGSSMNIALTCPKHIYDQKEAVNRLWAASFEQITGETFESLKP